MTDTPLNPITPFLEEQGALVLDGGLATELERRGCDLSDELWSARLLLEDPELIRQVHLDYYRAGADCGTSASYQATIPGLIKRGLTSSQAEELLQLSVHLTRSARDQFWSQCRDRNRLRPLVAASIGPYGAYLADGSEYRGDYGLPVDDLVDFHRRRWEVLTDSGPDVLACETLPSFLEAEALLRLLDQSASTYAWFSFTCRDGEHISDGTRIEACAALLSDHPRVVAIGVNCTPPRYIPELVRRIHSATLKPVIVYPNSGEMYDATQKRWLGESVPSEFGTYSREWRKLGAALIGGCCRTTPEHIRQISDRLRKKPRRASSSQVN